MAGLQRMPTTEPAWLSRGSPGVPELDTCAVIPANPRAGPLSMAEATDVTVAALECSATPAPP